MKIGNGWTKTTENKETYITIALDEALGVMFPLLKPLLKDCFITLWHIPKDERKSDNSPSWSVNITVKKEQKETAETPEEDLPF